MADKKLNEVTTVPTASINNVKTFLAVMNDGSIQQMSKADMATVLGGLLQTYLSWCPILVTTETDANNIQNTSVVLNMNSMSNVPYTYGTLFTVAANNVHIVQLYACAASANLLYFRQRSNNAWTDWVSLAFQ